MHTQKNFKNNPVLPFQRMSQLVKHLSPLPLGLIATDPGNAGLPTDHANFDHQDLDEFGALKSKNNNSLNWMVPIFCMQITHKETLQTPNPHHQLPSFKVGPQGEPFQKKRIVYIIENAPMSEIIHINQITPTHLRPTRAA